MGAPFFTTKRQEFISRSLMDVFKVLLPTVLLSGLLIKPIPWLFKLSAIAGLAMLFGFSIYLFPRGD